MIVIIIIVMMNCRHDFWGIPATSRLVNNTSDRKTQPPWTSQQPCFYRFSWTKYRIQGSLDYGTPSPLDILQHTTTFLKLLNPRKSGSTLWHLFPLYTYIILVLNIIIICIRISLSLSIYIYIYRYVYIYIYIYVHVCIYMIICMCVYIYIYIYIYSYQSISVYIYI